VPAVVLAGTGAAFLVAAQRASGRLDDILATSGAHYLDEAEQERTRWRDESLISGLAFAAAGVFTVTAIVMAATQPSPGAQTAVLPAVGAHHVGLAFAAKF
jgi:hypothetical protein